MFLADITANNDELTTIFLVLGIIVMAVWLILAIVRRG
jgi:uncharacterized membrane protein